MKRPVVAMVLTIMVLGNLILSGSSAPYSGRVNHFPLKNRRLTILGVNVQARRYGEQARGSIENMLTEALLDKQIILIEKKQIRDIVGNGQAEKKAGYIDNATAAEYGRVLGSELVCLADCEYVFRSDAHTRVGSVRVHVRIIDSESGRIFFSKSFSHNVRERTKHKYAGRERCPTCGHLWSKDYEDAAELTYRETALQAVSDELGTTL